MRKVLRGYAKGKDSNLILIGTMPIPHSKDKSSPRERRTSGIWSGKAQQSLRKKQWANPFHVKSLNRVNVPLAQETAINLQTFGDGDVS